MANTCAALGAALTDEDKLLTSHAVETMCRERPEALVGECSLAMLPSATKELCNKMVTTTVLDDTFQPMEKRGIKGASPQIWSSACTDKSQVSVQVTPVKSSHIAHANISNDGQVFMLGSAYSFDRGVTWHEDRDSYDMTTRCFMSATGNTVLIARVDGDFKMTASLCLNRDTSKITELPLLGDQLVTKERLRNWTEDVCATISDDDQVIVVVYRERSSGAYMIRVSKDRGGTFSRHTISGNPHLSSIRVSATGRSISMRVSLRMYISRDYGKTWTQSPNMFHAATRYQPAWVGDGHSILLASTGGITQYSRDDLLEPRVITKFPGNNTNIKFQASRDGRVMIAANDAGIHLSTNFGNYWHHVFGFQGSTYYVSISKNGKHALYGGSEGDHTYVETNNVGRFATTVTKGKQTYLSSHGRVVVKDGATELTTTEIDSRFNSDVEVLLPIDWQAGVPGSWVTDNGRYILDFTSYNEFVLYRNLLNSYYYKQWCGAGQGNRCLKLYREYCDIVDDPRCHCIDHKKAAIGIGYRLDEYDDITRRRIEKLAPCVSTRCQEKVQAEEENYPTATARTNCPDTLTFCASIVNNEGKVAGDVTVNPTCGVDDPKMRCSGTDEDCPLGYVCKAGWCADANTNSGGSGGDSGGGGSGGGPEWWMILLIVVGVLFTLIIGIMFTTGRWHTHPFPRSRKNA